MRGATGVTKKKETPIKISIHAPHAGSDCKQSKEMLLQRYFNPRSPCGERRLRPRRSCRADDFNPRSPCGERPLPSVLGIEAVIFQSTLPMRGATKTDMIKSKPVIFQSTLPMRGATLSIASGIPNKAISIHAPHAGSDCKHLPKRKVYQVFQSTLPMRGATSRKILSPY